MQAGQKRYVSLCERTVAPGGIAIVATFALDGPEMCSGLPVQRYDAIGLAQRRSDACLRIARLT